MNDLAFVFPGQGSQSVGMLSDLANHYPLITHTFQMASDALGWDIWELIQTGPEKELNQTTHTQVAMLCADVAVFRLLQELGLPKANWMAGHSLGEYAALVCASAIDLPEAAKLVAKRAFVMQETVPLGVGAMAAIVGLSDEEVADICALASTSAKQVTPANFNAIGQVVIAGHLEAIERAVILAEQKGARLAKIIPVSVPCHCPLLEEAAGAFAESLAKAPIKSPSAKVISNVDLSVYESPDQIRTLLKEQLFKPVRWVETIQLLHAKGNHHFIECGPGKVLSGLIKRINKSLITYSANDTNSLEQVLACVSAE